MKQINTENTQTQITEKVNHQDLEFNDIVVYNEMAENTEVRINMLAQINNQLNQLQEMSLRRQYLMKEVFQQFID